MQCRLVFSVSVILFAPLRLAAAPAYSALDLGPANSLPFVNNRGQVAFTQDWQAKRYTDGVGVEIIAASQYSQATGINNHGQVAGTTPYAAYPGVQPFRYTDGIGLEFLCQPDMETETGGINDHGQVAFSSSELPFRYTDGVGAEYLYSGPLFPPMGAHPSPGPIDDAGETLWYMNGAPSICTSPSVWKNTWPALDWGTALSPMGDIGGEHNGSATILRHDGSSVDLGSIDGLFTRVTAISASGLIIGTAGHTRYSDETVWSWDSESGFRNLNDLIDPSLNWSLVSFHSVNDIGQVAGVAMVNGTAHSVRLTPIETTVPEPGTLVFFGAGILPLIHGAALRRRRTDTGRREGH